MSTPTPAPYDAEPTLPLTTTDAERGPISTTDAARLPMSTDDAARPPMSTDDAARRPVRMVTVVLGLALLVALGLGVTLGFTDAAVDPGVVTIAALLGLGLLLLGGSLRPRRRT